MSMILPATDDPDSEGFWAAAREERLVVQRLADGRLAFPPRAAQPGSSWQEVSGRGTIWSFIVAHGPTLPPYSNHVPYPVAIVTLAEGQHLRMVGNLVTRPDAPIDSVPVEDIAIGRAVQVCFRRAETDVMLPCWIPV